MNKNIYLKAQAIYYKDPTEEQIELIKLGLSNIEMKEEELVPCLVKVANIIEVNLATNTEFLVIDLEGGNRFPVKCKMKVMERLLKEAGGVIFNVETNSYED